MLCWEIENMKNVDCVNVVYSSSDSYAWIMCTSLISLLENNLDLNFKIFLLSNNISQENLIKISKSIANYHCELNVLDISSYKNKIGNIKINERWDFATFGRLFEAEILPDGVKKVIHIDCDTIINGSIKELWRCDVSEKIVAGVCDCMNSRYLKAAEMMRPNYIFNAGVLIFNLENIKKDNLVNQFNEFLNSHNRLMYLDQDVINSCIPFDMKLKLPLKYNCYSLICYSNYKEILALRNPYNFYSQAEVEDAKNNPCIIHFTTSNLDYGRAWCVLNNHPYKDKFIFYLMKTEFKEHGLLKNKKSYKTWLILKLPRFISIKVARFINSFLKPTLFKNK